MVPLVIASAALDLCPALAQAPAAGPFDSTSLLAVAAGHAREAATRIARPARAPRPDAAATQYLAGLAQLNRNQFDSALVPLRAAATANANSALYHGDLAFALAETGRWSDAEDEYRAAVRLQQANPWYFVGLGATQAAQAHWGQAAASYTLAVAADSAVVIQQLIAPASDAFQQAGMAQALEDWARMATSRFPNEPIPWLRLASASYMRRDTVVGFPAIRRFRSLKPDDRVGAMLYSEYLLAAGQYDSAAVLAHQAAPDSSMRHLAAVVMYNVGGHLLQGGQFARATEVLQEGRELASASDQPMYDLYLGIAKLRMLQVFYNEAAQHSDCRKSHAADSMLTDVAHLVTAGVAADSAIANQVLTGAIQQYRTAIDGFVRQCRR
jgi:Flp pilus assembly protein TadD